MLDPFPTRLIGRFRHRSLARLCRCLPCSPSPCLKSIRLDLQRFGAACFSAQRHFLYSSKVVPYPRTTFPRSACFSWSRYARTPFLLDFSAGFPMMEFRNSPWTALLSSTIIQSQVNFVYASNLPLPIFSFSPLNPAHFVTGVVTNIRRSSVHSFLSSVPLHLCLPI